MLLACKKNSDVTKVEALTKFPPPTWQVDETGKYPVTMTAVIALPSTLPQELTTNDRLAAFVNEECRGEGTLLKVNNVNVFFVLIRGVSEEQSKVSFKYYNAGTSYMYQSQTPLTFHVDDIYGTAEQPKVLDLIQLE